MSSTESNPVIFFLFVPCAAPSPDAAAADPGSALTGIRVGGWRSVASMYFFKHLRHEVLLTPECFGPRLKNVIRRKLSDEVEGTCIQGIGYVVCVMDVEDENIGKGLVEYETGNASFMVTYGAILFRPFDKEVLDATVTSVNQLGFFCKAGPLQIFVSRHNMPGDMREGFNAATDMWVSQDGVVEVKRGCVVRLRIMGLAMEAAKITAVGNISDDFLGVIELP